MQAVPTLVNLGVRAAPYVSSGLRRLRQRLMGTHTSTADAGHIGRVFRPDTKIYAGRGEMHAVDVTTNQEIINTPNPILLNGCARGDDIADRTGRRIQMKGLVYQFNAWQKTSGVIANVRYIIVYDRQPNGAAPNWTDVMATASTQTLTNFTNRGRFKILKNELLTFPAVGGQDRAVNQYRKGYIKLNLPCEFGSGSTGAIGDFTRGSLYMFYIGENATGSSAQELRFQSRVYFKDM